MYPFILILMRPVLRSFAAKAISAHIYCPIAIVTSSALHAEDALWTQWNRRLREGMRCQVLLAFSAHSKADKAEHR